MSEENKNLNEQAPEQKPVEIKKPLDQKTLGIIIGAAVAVVAVIAIVLALVLGGGAPSETPTPDQDPAGDVVTDVDYKLGMGAVVSIGETNAQVDGLVATVVLDKDGKIVLCRVDAIQNKVTLNDDGTFTIGNTKTKRELGYDYNMAKFGHSLVGNEKVLEWFEQADAFEAWCVGKTVAEVEAMATQTMSNGYVISADDALLNAGCTISIGDFVAAVAKACKDDQAVSFKTSGTVTLGLAVNSADSGSAKATEETVGAIQIYSDFAATALVDGKVVAALNDSIQPKSNFDATGAVTATTFKGTKRELKEGYNMAAFGHSLVGNEKVVEWYLQSAAFSAHIVGMTSAQIDTMATQTMSNGYIISADEALLGAGCTMSIDAIIDVVVESIANAR